MKHKAAFLSFDVNFDYPTSKELKLFLGKSAKLLYGNDKRITKDTPYRDKLHLITHAFAPFTFFLFQTGFGYSNCISSTIKSTRVIFY